VSQRATQHARRLAFITLIGLGSASSGCGPPSEAETDCVRGGQVVDPDDIVQGHRAGDILAPYFGTFHGQLTWSDGGAVAFTLDMVEEPEEPVRLADVYECRAHNIETGATSHVATEDGVLDHELAARIYSGFPDPPPGTPVYPALTLSVIESEDWGEPLAERLPVDTSRYESTALEFAVDWPRAPVPRGGKLLFYGMLLGTDLFDSFEVATLTF